MWRLQVKIHLVFGSFYSDDRQAQVSNNRILFQNLQRNHLITVKQTNTVVSYSNVRCMYFIKQIGRVIYRVLVGCVFVGRYGHLCGRLNVETAGFSADSGARNALAGRVRPRN